MQKFIDLKKTAQSHYDNILKKPRIRVGTDISGVAAGSLEISNEFSKYISEKNLDTTLSHVGGFGLSYAEPLIDVEMPDGSRVFYSNVSIQNVKNIVESHIINGKPLYDIAFAYTGNLVNTNNTPEFYELPENKLQKKILTENFGHIDPTDIYEYIVNNGYSALAKALFEISGGNMPDIFWDGIVPLSQIIFGQPDDEKLIIAEEDASFLTIKPIKYMLGFSDPTNTNKDDFKGEISPLKEINIETF